MTVASLVMSYVIGIAKHPKLWSIRPAVNIHYSFLFFQEEGVIYLDVHTTLSHIAAIVRHYERTITDGC